MLMLCAECPHTQRCRQMAADAPFTATGVWGGLVLPREAAQLPEPVRQAQYPPELPVNGRPPWWSGMGRNYESVYSA